MTFVSLAINHKLRPTYRKIGTSVGEFIADMTNADGAQRQKIISTAAKAASIGLSVGCAVLTADAAGLIHTAATGTAAEAAASTHAEAIASAHAGAITSAHAPLSQAYAAPAAPLSYTGSPNTAAALAGFNQQSEIMATVTAPDLAG